MQWSAQDNGGFSTAPKDRLAYPSIDEGPYGYQHVNIAAQRRDPNSLLSWLERIIRTRKECPELGWALPRILRMKQANVLALCYEWQGGSVLAIHNLSGEGGVVKLDLSEYQAERMIDLLGDRVYQQLEDGQCELLLEGYGYRWFRLDGGRYTAG
jgi:maltose alpha-D-glucosyltransferase/alpha-amylase